MSAPDNVIRFPVERCRKSNAQEVEDAIREFERAQRAWHEAHEDLWFTDDEELLK